MVSWPWPRPLATLATAVASYDPYLQRSGPAAGELFDPVFAEPTQYGTPYHAFCRAVLAARGTPGQAEEQGRLAAAGLSAALRHLSDPNQPPTASAANRVTGSLSAVNHRDFFWPPVLKAYRLLRALGHPQAPAWAQQIASVDILRAFRSRPPSNWAMVWLSGEWLRMQEGLSPTSPETFDRWLGAFFAQHILLEQGLYQEPGHPNSYDLFTRYHLADLLAEGYDGRWRPELEALMESGLRRSLAVQLSDGSLASAYRSTGQTWTVGAQVAYFTLAARYFHRRQPQLSRQSALAAWRAYASFLRWQRPGGPYSPVENLLPPAYRVGYEAYTCDGHYGNLAMAFLAVAILHGFGDPESPTGPPPAWPELVRREAVAYVEGDPTYRALAHCGRYSAHVNAFPSPRYDGFGLVDLTFGPGRYFQFASSVRHLSEATFFNPGLALRAGPGRSELTIPGQQQPHLIGSIVTGPEPASLRLRARGKGDPYIYRLEVQVDEGGVAVREAVPGRSGLKSLLIPYLRDAGTGQTTRVDVTSAGEGTLVRWQLGGEAVCLRVEAPLEAALDWPYGYENRRGLCGLLRLDLAGEREEIGYHFAVER